MTRLRGKRATKLVAATALVALLLAVIQSAGPASAAETTSPLDRAVAQLESCQAMRAVASTSAERSWANTCIRLAQRVVDSLTPAPEPTASPTASPSPTSSPTPSPTASPTASPTPTSSPSPTPSPTPSPGCALPLYPTAACTGVPAGWTPSRIISGSYTTRADGEVIDGWRVTGSIEVRHQGVTVRNSEVYTRIYNQASGVAYNGLIVEDTTIGPPSGNSGATTGAIGVCGYTARRVEVRNAPEGFRVGGYGYSGNRCGPVVVVDSYVKLTADGCDHSDGVQEYDGIPSGMIVRHNTIDMAGVGCATAPIYVGDFGGVFADNLLLGGSYTLRLHRWTSGARYPQVTGNRIVDGVWDYGPALVDSCSIVDVWSSNWVVRLVDGHMTLLRLLTICPETQYASGTVLP